MYILPHPDGYLPGRAFLARTQTGRDGTLRLYFPIIGGHKMDRAAGRRAREAQFEI